MNWRALLERIVLTLLMTVGGGVLGMFLGASYAHLSTTLSAWDSLSLVIGGLFFGCLTGLLAGILFSIYLKDSNRRTALLIVFLFDVIAIVFMAVTDYMD